MSAQSAKNQRETFAARLQEAGLSTERFIPVHEGDKASTDHRQSAPEDTRLSGNYGVYAGKGADGSGGYLVDIDIDDYGSDVDSDALRALKGLPDTFAVKSPHTGADSPGHRYYAVTGDVVSAIEEVSDGATNPAPSWGEIRVKNQYTVGPGSVLDSCDKDWHDCSEAGEGYYQIAENREIAEISAETLVKVLCADPNYPKEATNEAENFRGEASETDDKTLNERLQAAFEASPTGEKYENIYNGNYALAGYSDRSKAEFALANWLDQWVGHGSLGDVASLMSAGNLSKWGERTDDSYRNSVLKEVGTQESYFDPLNEERKASEETTATFAHQRYPLKEVDTGGRTTAELFDRGEHWENLRGERYDQYLQERDTAPVVWRDPAGAGKTTNAVLAAIERDNHFTALFQRHEKAFEVRSDKPISDAVSASKSTPVHVKGASQPVFDCCLEAAAKAKRTPGESAKNAECEEHGERENWPLMCPTAGLRRDDPTRERFDALAGMPSIGSVHAHRVLDLHGDDPCAYQETHGKASGRKWAYGVHEHQVVGGMTKDSDVLVDESPRAGGDKTVTDTDALRNMADCLDDIHGWQGNGPELARFARDIATVARKGEPLNTVDLPEIKWKTQHIKATPHLSSAEPFSEYKSGKETIADGGELTIHTLRAETLARLKLNYTETVVGRIEHDNDDWKDAPDAFDTLLAVIAEVSEEKPLIEAAKIALAAPGSVRTRCPWCSAPTEGQNGRFVCQSGCGWDEKGPIVQPRGNDPRPADSARKARVVAWTPDTAREDSGLHYRTLPDARELSGDTFPLVMDATATPAKIATLYGVSEESVTVAGDRQLAANMNVTQVTRGAYHSAQIKQNDGKNERHREKLQQVIEAACERNEKVLFGVQKSLEALFEWPENAVTLPYGGAVGANMNDCDAVVCLHAPHSPPDALRRKAALLAQGHDCDAGGDEYGTREGDETETIREPEYRDYNYEAPDGSGRAVATKGYTGLTGDLFKEAREKEIEQFVHRARPILSKEPVEVLLCTNVPTEIPVDTLVNGIEDLPGVKTEKTASEKITEALDREPVTAKDIAAAVECTERQARNALNDLVDSDKAEKKTQGGRKPNLFRAKE